MKACPSTSPPRTSPPCLRATTPFSTLGSGPSPTCLANILSSRNTWTSTGMMKELVLRLCDLAFCLPMVVAASQGCARCMKLGSANQNQKQVLYLNIPLKVSLYKQKVSFAYNIPKNYCGFPVTEPKFVPNQGSTEPVIHHKLGVSSRNLGSIILNITVQAALERDDEERQQREGRAALCFGP